MALRRSQCRCDSLPEHGAPHRKALAPTAAADKLILQATHQAPQLSPTIIR